MPLFLLVIFGAVGLADLIIAEQRLDEACGRAARCAACGGSPDQIRDCVIAVLGPERGRRAKIIVRPVGRRGHDNDDRGNGHDKDNDGHDDHDRGRGNGRGNGHDKDDHGNGKGRGHDKDDHEGGIECHPVRCGELLEVCIELEACSATATRLAPIRRSEKLLARAVMQRE